MRTAIKKYVELISGYISGEIPVDDFEGKYLQMVKDEKSIFPEEISKIIGTLFSDLDSFYPDPELWEPGDIGEEELLQNAKTALHKLKRLTEDEQRTKD